MFWISFLAIVVSVLSFILSWQARVDAARVELLGHLVRIVQLDRAATRRNGHLVSALGQQCEASIRLYKAFQLQLSPTVYRMLGEYMLLDTDELSIASKMLCRGKQSARRTKNDLELIRCNRAEGEVAAAQLDPVAMKDCFDAAIRLAKERATKTQPALFESKNRTYALAALAALVANEHNPENSEWLRLAQLYSTELGDGMGNLLRAGSLEVARRAHRLKHSPPKGFESLLPSEWQELWSNRDPAGVS